MKDMKRPPRKRLLNKQREAKEEEWKRYARRLRRGKVKAPWDQIPGSDAEAIAFEHGELPRVVEILKSHGVKFWHLGPLDQFCGRPNHNH